jgi:hypothetical protein
VEGLLTRNEIPCYQIVAPDQAAPSKDPHLKIVGVRPGANLKEIEILLGQYAPIRLIWFTKKPRQDGTRAVWVNFYAAEDAQIFLGLGELPFKDAAIRFEPPDYKQSVQAPKSREARRARARTRRPLHTPLEE